ncbi:hypothetical protein L1049_022904 [Liquidambar formosana]|uniref:Large ribosomal subunit protein uL6 alpha-beta domain-containing protein n=1 Tax=Liquidambar formosana TaxID=63359 RepID=A0AAP0RD67_LIQFO
MQDDGAVIVSPSSVFIGSGPLSSAELKLVSLEGFPRSPSMPKDVLAVARSGLFAFRRISHFAGTQTKMEFGHVITEKEKKGQPKRVIVGSEKFVVGFLNGFWERMKKKKERSRRRRLKGDPFGTCDWLLVLIGAMGIGFGAKLKWGENKGEGEDRTSGGPRGKLSRNFKHLNLDFQPIKDESNGGNQKLKVDAWFGSRKTTAAIRTALSHVDNLITGITKGYRYKMRFVYAHFPINASITNTNTNKSIEIRNFLGEKKVREMGMLEGVTIVRSEKVKDELILDGNDIELVSRSAALMNQYRYYSIAMKTYTSYVVMVLVQFAYGGSNILMKIALEKGLNQLVFVVYWHVIAMFCLHSFSVFARIFVLASLGTTIHLNVYYAGLAYTSPTVASAMSNVIPSLTFLLAVLLGMEKVKISCVRGRAKVLDGTVGITFTAKLTESIIRETGSFNVTKITPF